MKASSKILLAVALAIGTMFAGNVWATPVTFTPDVGLSSVTVTDSAPNGNLTAALVLSPTAFTVGDGATQSLDFFTLTASGLAWQQDYTIAANLYFSAPQVASHGSGGGKFTTIFGLISGGNLIWNPATLPDTFLLADGNTISIDFESGSKVVLGDTILLHAYVTNQGGGVAPVPEPGTMMLLGLGFLSLAIYGKRRRNV